MALSFQWDEIAFRKATAGWKPMPAMIYRTIIPWLHLNDGSVTDRQLEVGYRDFGLDPKTWRRWIAFIKDEGKLVRTQSGEWTNGRVAKDHERITRRRSATVGDETQKNPEQYSINSRASAPPLQGTGIQEYRNTGNKREACAVAPPQGSKSVDPWKPVYDAGKPLLAAYGIKNPGAVITRLKKQSGASAQAFMGAIQSAGERERSNIVEYLQGCLRDNEPEPPPWSAQAHLDALQNIVEERENGTQQGSHAFDWADHGFGSADDASGAEGIPRLAASLRDDA